MRTAEMVNLIYFSLLTVLAVFWPMPSRSRIKAVAIGIAGLGVVGLASVLPDAFRNLLPAPLMAVAYWQSGCFFRKPNPRLQKIFEASDRAILRILCADLRRWSKTWIGTMLELAYVLCYPVVPLGLAALYIAGVGSRVDDYWSVVLLSAYPCYALLPFVQLLPPRLVERNAGPEPELARSLRRFNLWLVRQVTHEANTFPSGHVAASAAIALLLLWLAPLWGVVFAFIAIGIAAGCIVGRYHYVIDVGAALLLSGTVFALLTLQN